MPKIKSPITKNKSSRKWLLKLSIGVFLLYIFIFIIAALFQNHLVYPVPKRTNQPCSKEYFNIITTKNKTKLYHQHVKNSDTLAVFYHGNGDIVCDKTNILDALKEQNVSYLFVEYTGYDDNNNPSHEKILTNVQDTIDYINKQHYAHVYIIGQSIGSGAASYHTSIQPPEKLLLISPFTTLTNTMNSILPIYPRFFVDKFFNSPFDSKKYLQNYTGKLVVLHGTLDKIVPYKQGVELFKATPSIHKEFISAEKYGHESINDYKNMPSLIDSFIN